MPRGQLRGTDRRTGGQGDKPDGADKRSNGMKTFYTCFNVRDDAAREGGGKGVWGVKGNGIEVKLKPFANSC